MVWQYRTSLEIRSISFVGRQAGLPPKSYEIAQTDAVATVIALARVTTMKLLMFGQLVFSSTKWSRALIPLRLAMRSALTGISSMVIFHFQLMKIDGSRVDHPSATLLKTSSAKYSSLIRGIGQVLIRLCHIVSLRTLRTDCPFTHFLTHCPNNR